MSSCGLRDRSTFRPGRPKLKSPEKPEQQNGTAGPDGAHPTPKPGRLDLKPIGPFYVCVFPSIPVETLDSLKDFLTLSFFNTS